MPNSDPATYRRMMITHVTYIFMENKIKIYLPFTTRSFQTFTVLPAVQLSS